MNRREFIIKASALASALALSQNGALPAEAAQNTSPLRKADFFKVLPDGRIHCTLCPLDEKLKPGRMGACRVRIAGKGVLNVTNYGRPAAMHLDPVEKNPLYHFTPGAQSLALATAGCNLACPACQNWEISQKTTDQVKTYNLPPEKAVHHALKNRCDAVTYTFSEPVVFYEYMMDTCILAKKNGLSNHVVTGGYISGPPLAKLCSVADSFVVSIKGINDGDYGGRPGAFETVKRTLAAVAARGLWLEVAVLVVPTVNDSDGVMDSICRWIKENLGQDVPVHFSRFFPSFRLRNLPQTPVATLERIRNNAVKTGIRYAYIGNVPGHIHNNTFCHNCNKMLVQRVGFRILKNLVENGKCSFCGADIPGRWK